MSTPNPKLWVVDTSTFIHFTIIEMVPMLAEPRRPLRVTRYVYERELCGTNCHARTRAAAKTALDRGYFVIDTLRLDDLERIGTLNVPRKVAMGEITCAVVAERDEGAVLLDDRKAILRLREEVNVRAWESTEDVLVDAAHQHRVSEYQLHDFDAKLESEKYRCRFSLREEYLRQRLSRTVSGSASEGTS